MSSPNRSCDLNPLDKPTTLLKACFGALLYPIKHLYMHHCSGLFHDDFNPLLKKSTLTKENLNSYRSISNLSFISKVPEKVVVSRLTSHIDSSCMYNVVQLFYSFILQRLLF